MAARVQIPASPLKALRINILRAFLFARTLPDNICRYWPTTVILPSRLFTHRCLTTDTTTANLIDGGQGVRLVRVRVPVEHFGR